VNAHDPDAGQAVEIYPSALPPGATFSGNTFSWAPSFFQVGTYTVAFAAVDNGTPALISETQEITITVNNVNQTPIAAPDLLVAEEDHVAQPLDPKANDADPDGDALAVTAVSQGSNGAVTLNTDGTVTYTPNPDFNGADSFTYTLSDGKDGLATGTVVVTVTSVNDPPSFAKGADQTVNEDAGPQGVAGWATRLSAGPANEGGQVLHFAVANDNPGLFVGLPAVSPDGTLSYATAPDANGVATLTVRVRDSGGTTGGGVDSSAAQTFVLTVTPVNDPPVLAVIADQALDEGQTLTFEVSATDSDSPVSLSLADVPEGATLTDNHNGTADFTWTPGYTQAGDHTLTFTASDGSLSDSKAVTLTVNNVTRTLTATAGFGGTVNPAGVRVVDYGSDQTFTFTHATGYHLDDVLVDGIPVGTVATYTFADISADHTIEARFALDTFTLTATAGANGGIAPANQTVVTYGGNLSYSITPAAGYSIADVLVDGVSVGAVSSYNFNNITADHTIAASFADVTPPVVTAQLTGVWGISRGEEEEDGGPMYRVQVSATDGADPQPAITAYITQPLSPPAAATVSYKKEKKVRIKIKKESRKLQVQLEGPNGSEETLRRLWADAYDLGGFKVVDNQVVRLTTKEGDSAESEYRFDKQGNLTSAKAPNLKLVASAKDASGNPSAKAEASPPRFRLSKSAAEALAQGMEVVSGHFRLSANYPNPFNPSTTLRYDLDNLQEVRLTIYNAMGQQVRVLVDQAQGPGSYEVQWDGRDGSGQLVASGFYLYRLQAGDQVAVQKMLFAK
ncbi:MAG: tandem-95 repeat protein, partial [Candidatus Latescibacteria bacterium]|nr:tandem-95 repeat protein [Candidatus Latescibacterota bacterium]